ncbi:MAG: glycogen-binding domain-containing protein [Gemmatimonadetes bacterium]|nr:glycogen-binding domain-containing protein [Gemmatimonadota bacterium]
MSNDDLHRYLDGELELDQLPEEARAEIASEAASWDRLLDTYRTTYPGSSAPSWLEHRVMAEIEALREPGFLARAWGWLLRPRPVRLSPATLGLAVASVAALLLLVRGRSPVPTGGVGVPAAAVVYVQFDLTAPQARSVSVGGDFDEWRGSYALEDPDGDGTWTGRVPVRPGLHAYMFLVDGSKWVTDPEAGHYTDDGFGNRNAVVAVTAPTT